ncbi:hypothetical protein BCR35DRAFT_306864 [Leucosporidium creatinivorum]|uniref:VASt domain-containing protein n=1 Tax=Leucosporidium creatinivorum TaxID=106004 RepID=A0A1Y2ER51_9BASI|nr:hypothetical protein BCR35DRAFT_306864 [Leucosporidium creatinivorum]
MAPPDTDHGEQPITSTSSTDSLVVLHSHSMDQPTATQPSSEAAEAAIARSHDKAAVLDTGAAGVGDGKLTLEAMEKPPAADGGVEAVVGIAHGEQPEVIAVADEEKTTKLSWIKQKLTPSSSSDKATSGARSRSASILSRASREEDTPKASSPADPLPAITPGVPEAEEPVRPTKVTTDSSGKPVPVEVGPVSGAGAPSITTSLRDDLSDQMDLDPSTSHAKFHSMFTGTIPEEEELIEDYRCALQRDILVQGRLFVTERHLAFRANIFGWETSLAIPWSEVTTIEKRMTAKVIPNAIEVSTLHSRHIFASLLNRDAAYELLVATWRWNHPEEQRVRDRSDSLSTAFTNDRNQDARSEISFEGDDGQKKKHRFSSAIAGVGNKLKAIRSRDGHGSGGGDGKTEAEKVKEEALQGELGHDPTEYDGEEYANVALDVVLPTSPEKAYKLFFKDEAFLRPFFEETEGLKEVNIGEWESTEGDLEKREMDYIKPLNSSIGPKQTKCLIADENEKVDPETYISNETITRTPDVPSGNDFSVKTKSVFTWSAQGGCHVKVTTEVAWTKVNRMLKGIIERSCIDGQKTYHSDLEKAAREHIDSHKDDFADPGVTTTSSAPAAATADSPSDSSAPTLLDQLTTPSPLLFLAIAFVVLLFTNFWTLVALRHQARAAHEARLGHPGEVASAVNRVLESFNSAHEKRGGGSLALGNELKAVVQRVRGLETGLKEVVDRLEGIQKRM